MNQKIFGSRSSGLLSAVFLAAGLTLLISFGCDRDPTGLQTTSTVTPAAISGAPQELSLEIVSHTDCKTSVAATASDDITANQTAVIWEYDDNGTLSLHRINAAYNCCPDIISSVDLTDRTITVFERDAGQCYCICLMDVDYRITDVKPGKYTLRFDEYTAIGDDQPLECEIILKGSGSSGMCVAERNYYPWGAVPTGELIDYPLVQSCCDMGYTACFTWDYDDTDTLRLSHCNIYGSCCPFSADAVFSFSGNVITITENVPIGILTMMINLKLDMVIANLPAGEYRIIVNRFGGLGTVEFTADLINEPTGMYFLMEDPW